MSAYYKSTTLKKILDMFFYLIFWITFFQILRLFFIVYHLKIFAGIPIIEIIKVLPYSLRLDISAVCYIFIAIFFLLILSEFIKKNLIANIITYYSYMWIIITSLIAVVDVQIYKEWGSKINSEALSFFNTPNEIISSIISSPVILLLTLFILFSALGILLYSRVFKLSQRFIIPQQQG
ncbi:MAG: hypothetical protein GWP19_08980, partial [Planctomycetia bacterium]|nr:hypothetical protein [Planctomycetia bacterium]